VDQLFFVLLVLVFHLGQPGHLGLNDPIITYDPREENSEKKEEEDKKGGEESGDRELFDPACAIRHQEYGDLFEGHLSLPQ